jgi:hypothetical protein
MLTAVAYISIYFRAGSCYGHIVALCGDSDLASQVVLLRLVFVPCCQTFKVFGLFYFWRGKLRIVTPIAVEQKDGAA